MKNLVDDIKNFLKLLVTIFFPFFLPKKKKINLKEILE